MSFFRNWVVDLSQWFRGHLDELSLIMAAIILSWLSRPVFDYIRKIISGRYHILVRIPIYSVVILLLFGLGLKFFPIWIGQVFNLFNDLTLAPILIILIFLMAMVFER